MTTPRRKRRSDALAGAEAARRQLMAWYKKNARIRGVPWTLSYMQFCRVIDVACWYCETPADRVAWLRRNDSRFRYTGIDRLNSDEGYTLANVVPCCWTCNRAKGSMPQIVWQAWIDRLCVARIAQLPHRFKPTRRRT